MPELVPSAVKKKLENECKKIAKKAGKKIKPEKVGKKAEEAIRDGVCKEVKNIDKKIAELVVGAMKKHVNKGSDDVPSPDAKPTASKKPPGSGVPSITIPITDWVVDEKLDTTAKFELKIWADPRDLQNKDKGIMLNFTVVNW